MVQLSTLLASFAILVLTSAAPLTVPLGLTGQSLSISEDGQTISIGSQSIDIRSAMGRSNSCKSSTGGKKGAGGGKGSDTNSGNASTPNPQAATAKAIYFITNAAENSVVALKVASDGTLSDGSITATGGNGMVGVDKEGAPAVPDGTFSQGALKVAGNMLIAVNPGSNTISMFTISAADPTNLTMVGQPADTLGEFPMSVTISTELSQACVANSGSKAGIACFSVCKTKGLTPLDSTLRPINLNQSTPPIGPTNTISQTFFNSDSTALITTVKGDPAVNNTGFLSVFPIENGRVSRNETRSSPNGTAVLFGTALIPSPANSIFVTDASFGTATLSLSGDNIATVSTQTKIKDQVATCWAAFSDLTGTAFVTDVVKNHLVEVDTVAGNLVMDLESGNGNPGMVDLVSAGRFLYALSPGNGTVKAAVTVFDVGGGRGAAKEIQNFNPKGVEVTAQGMAFV